MEPSSTLLSLPFRKDLWKNLRKGQLETVELVAAGQRQVVTQLPTGYGKSKTASLSYAVARAMGAVNRLLVICPRKNQARQVFEWPRDIQDMCSITTRAINISDESIVALKANRNNSAEIYVSTIQALTASPRTWDVLTELMATGRWMVVVDEHHHYAEDNTWADRLASLSYVSLLAMSATPKRQDTKDFFGDPDVRVSYIDAYTEESAVKRMCLHQYEYEVDILKEGDCIQTYKAADLFDGLGVSMGDGVELTKVMAKRRLRWSPKYISPLVLYPIERIRDLRDTGIRSQMIMQAMNCEHAQMLCTQAKALVPSMSVDWVGTGPAGRSYKENEAILKRFCPKQVNGVRNWTLDILVNVGMAGEGLDTIDVTEVSIFTPGNITNSLLQLMGRASRIMQGVDPQPVASINCDVATELAKDDIYRGFKVMALFDSDIVQPSTIPDGEPEPQDYTEIPDEPLVDTHTNVRFKQVWTDPKFEPMVEQMMAHPERFGTTGWSEDQVQSMVIRALHVMDAERCSELDEVSVLAQLRNEVNKVVGTVGGLVLRRIAKSGVRIEKSLKTDIFRRINGRKARLFGKLEECDETARREQYKWVKELEQEIVKHEGLEGVPSWLR